MQIPIVCQLREYLEVCRENGDHHLVSHAESAIAMAFHISMFSMAVHGTPVIIDTLLAQVPLLQPLLRNDEAFQTPGFRFRVAMKSEPVNVPDDSREIVFLEHRDVRE